MIIFRPPPLDSRTNGVLKIPSLSRNAGNGFWLDTTGMVWRQTDMPKDQIADYAPVCTSSAAPPLQPPPPTMGRDGGDANR